MGMTTALRERADVMVRKQIDRMASIYPATIGEIRDSEAMTRLREALTHEIESTLRALVEECAQVAEERAKQWRGCDLNAAYQWALAAEDIAQAIREKGGTD